MDYLFMLHLRVPLSLKAFFFFFLIMLKAEGKKAIEKMK